MSSALAELPSYQERPALLAERRNAKMARSAHAYMRGNTVKFYEWLETAAGKAIPAGPSIWICGDCHVGNLGPVANLEGRVDIQIRDLDQTVVGNPAHDLIRLGLSLATAARSSDLPGVTTARMIEEMVIGYDEAIKDGHRRRREPDGDAKAVHRVLQAALRRRWKNLARERIEDLRPTIPRGDKFWELTKDENRQLESLIASDELRILITALRKRDDDAKIRLLDSAYWVKGCSSLGRLRYAALVGVGGKKSKTGDVCFLDIKEATAAAAPRAPEAVVPRDHAQRVVQGAHHLAPNLGERMLAGRFSEKSVVIRELMPQDLKLEIDQLTQREAVSAARFLATVVGEAHARQLDRTTRRGWRAALGQRRSKNIDAPSWLWTSIVELMASHEAGYLEHCRRYSLTPTH
ncbi:MAG TPA: DUF2252 family protein [Rhizomicrobium sp.]|jgi:uncharacterized protein (DUF2252 family)|nr:DUF2252 family protein [Rhizomicrobium sp.]